MFLTRIRNICARWTPKIVAQKGNTDATNKLYEELYVNIKDRVLTEAQQKALVAKTATQSATAPVSQPAPK